MALLTRFGHIKRTLSVLLSTFILACSIPKVSTQEPKDTDREVIRRILATTVSIGSTPNRVHGAGVVLKHSSGHPLVVTTALHVVTGIVRSWTDEPCDPENITHCFLIWVIPQPGFSVPMRLSRVQFSTDLALLESLAPMESSGPVAQLASKSPVVGDRVWIVGSPLGILNYLTVGIISNRAVLRKDFSPEPYEHFFTDATTYFGNSGGGAYSSSGELIGIVLAKTVTNNGVIISYKYLLPLLAQTN